VIPYPNIRPEIVQMGPIAIRWYGMMYVIGYILGFHILKARIRGGFFKIPLESADSFISHMVVGMLLGARLVYVTVYNWQYYSNHLAEIFAVHRGGLSFHGAAIGMITASLYFAHKHKATGYSALDTLAIGSCLALFVGRFGNFINGELYGRVTDVPWAMVFPTDPHKLPRHPSQIYQGFTEGLLLFFCLSFWHRRMKARGLYRDGQIGALFLMGYGFFRFFVEFTREADAQLGYFFGGLFSMGQILCFLTFLAGLLMWWHVSKVSPLWAWKSAPVKAPKGMDWVDRKLSWPLERFLARFVA
jgi:phosphatidylglycerol:prolipoprotein diacylglycerol transferase